VSARPSHPAGVGSCSRLATAVAGLGDEDWVGELVALGATVGDDARKGVPTYERLATAGTDTVAELVAAGRWDEASRQARRLTALFRRTRHQLHPLAAESFDGLHAAARARDREEVGDFVELLRELFGGVDG
jgi:hypothetical protein